MTFCSLKEKEGERWMRNERVRGRIDGWMDRQKVKRRNDYKNKRE